MPNIDWDDIGDIKHKIRHSLTAAIKMENFAKQMTETAVGLRMDITAELDKLDDIMNKENKKDEENSIGTGTFNDD